jgi:endonuclease/exonuclease/phosphatase family metal-dependent hydrolase
MNAQTEPFKFVTFNLRHNADRWDERFPMVVDLLAAASPHVIVMQEVWLPIYQAEQIADALNAQQPDAPYSVLTCPKWGEEESKEGVGLLTRLPVMHYEHLNLPIEPRIAQYARLRFGSSFVDVVNTHLHHVPWEDESIRLPQMQRILGWMNDRTAQRGEHHWLLAGDLNSGPDRETIQLAAKQFSSAIPSGTHTFPTSLSIDSPVGLSLHIDHIFYDDRFLTPLDWQVIGADAHPDDALLCASDHCGLAVTFEMHGLSS